MSQSREDFTQVDFDPPAGPLEKLLARIFADVLGVDRVGRGDNFFDLMGTSLQAIRICSRIERETGLRVRAAELFAQPDVEGLAIRLGQEEAVAGG